MPFLDILSSCSKVASENTSWNRKPLQRNIGSRWFREVFGKEEEPYLQGNIVNKSIGIDDILNDIPYYETTGLLHTANGIYHAGWFISPTVKEIREIMAILPLPVGSPTVEIIAGRDIGEVHVNGNNGECFQGASQLNALEMADMDEIPQNGIEQYIDDNTQGPRTALACAPGTFVRNYWLFQQYYGQFNALEYSNISHINGYLVWGTEPHVILGKINTDLLMIPAMIYTQVSGITKSHGSIKYHTQDKLVHQIYSSGVPVNTYRNGGSLELQLDIARKIIYAEYIGTIGLSIILHHFDKQRNLTQLQIPTVNLTLIGAGVFNVPEEVVIEELRRAIATFKNICHIKIHGYGQSTSAKLSRIFTSNSSISSSINPSPPKYSDDHWAQLAQPQTSSSVRPVSPPKYADNPWAQLPQPQTSSSVRPASPKYADDPWAQLAQPQTSSSVNKSPPKYSDDPWAQLAQPQTSSIKPISTKVASLPTKVASLPTKVASLPTKVGDDPWAQLAQPQSSSVKSMTTKVAPLPIIKSNMINFSNYRLYFIKDGRMEIFPLRDYQQNILIEAINQPHDHYFETYDTQAKIIVYRSAITKDYVYGFIGVDNIVKLFLTQVTESTARRILEEATRLYKP